MTIISVKLYRALKEAGVNEELAEQASEEVINFDKKLDTVNNDLNKKYDILNATFNIIIGLMTATFIMILCLFIQIQEKRNKEYKERTEILNRTKTFEPLNERRDREYKRKLEILNSTAHYDPENEDDMVEKRILEKAIKLGVYDPNFDPNQ